MKSAINLESVPQSGFIAFLENDIIRIFFSFSQQTTHEGESNTYNCNNVDVTDRSYEGIVDAIITESYPLSRQYALLANKALADDLTNELTEEKRREYSEEYQAFQQFRSEAKMLAQNIISSI